MPHESIIAQAAPEAESALALDFAGLWRDLLASGVDGVGLVVILMFALLGLWRGLWWQVVRLVGVLASVVAARAFGPRFADWLAPRIGEIDSTLLGALAWLTVFMGGLVLVVVIGRLGKSLLEALQLGLLDRFGGAIAGMLTALVLHAVGVAFLMQVTPRIWAAEHLEGTRSALLVDVLGEQATLLFDERTALAIDRRLERTETGEPAGADAAGGDAGASGE